MSAPCLWCRSQRQMPEFPKEICMMKILVVSNFYPPHYIGGYELGCRDVVEGLRARGHQVEVLTSIYGVNKAQEGDRVYRWLDTDFVVKDQDPAADLLWLVRKELRNRQAFKRLCKVFRPDVIYMWNLKYLSVSLALVAQRLGYPVCYFVSDHWLSEWENDTWYSQHHRLPKRFHRQLLWQGLSRIFKSTGLLSSRSLDLTHVHFASHYLKQAALRAGKPVKDAEVIHWGIDANLFSDEGEERNTLRLLYVGQLIANKGIQTAVEALQILTGQDSLRDVTLTIVGGPDYDDQVQGLVRSLGLDDQVQLKGFIPRERLPEIYQDHKILIFPSVWDEPFSITLLEAMASGLAVVGTQTGGSPEILEGEVNALVFEKENAQACADNVRRLVEDADLFRRIRQNARHTIERKHTLRYMVDKIEASLQKVAEKPGRRVRAQEKFCRRPAVRAG